MFLTKQRLNCWCISATSVWERVDHCASGLDGAVTEPTSPSHTNARYLHLTDVILTWGVVPLDFKIRRILLPIARKKVSKCPYLSNSPCRIFAEIRTSNNLDLGNTVGVTEDNTDLGRSGTLLGQLADVVNNLVGGGLEPRGSGAGVGDGGGGNALALAVKTTHFVLVMCPEELSVGVDEKIENR